MTPPAATTSARSLVLALCLAAVGCFEMRQEVALERDLSGTATLDLTLDLDRLAFASAYLEKTFGGEEGPVTDEERAAAREELLAQVEEDSFDVEKQRPAIEADLPEGVTLLDARQERDSLTIHTHLAVRFDHIRNLRELDLAGGRQDEVSGMAGAQARPFGSLQVVDEGSTLLLTNAAPDPTAEGEPGGADMMDMLGGMEELMDILLDGVRVVYRINAPFDAVDHNATRVDDGTLVWEYDLEHITEAGASPPPDLRVRYRK